MTASLPNDVTACLGESADHGVCPHRLSCLRYLDRHRNINRSPYLFSTAEYLCRDPQFAFFWNIHEKTSDDSPH